MKRNKLLKIISISIFLLLSLAVFSRAEQPLRIMTYNIHHGEGIDKVYDLNRIASVIAHEQADIVGLQEVYGVYRNSDKQVELFTQYLEKKTGQKWVGIFGGNIKVNDSYPYGNAILSKYPILSSENHTLLPTLGGEQRGCLEAKILYSKLTVTVFNTHWAHNSQEERKYSAESCYIWLSQTNPPFLFMGDLNTTPETEPIQQIKKVCRETFQNYDSMSTYTFPTENPNRKIDYIFLPSDSNPRLKHSRTSSGECYVVSYGDATVASDHRPVIAEYWITSTPTTK